MLSETKWYVYKIKMVENVFQTFHILSAIYISILCLLLYRCDSKLLPIAMIKNIKEPFLTLPIAKCNTIPANLQQIKELYEDNNYDSSQHNNVIGEFCYCGYIMS